MNLHPTIACINMAQTPLGVDWNAMLHALQEFTDKCFMPTWGLGATIIGGNVHVPGAWTMVFLDDPDDPNALGYHDLTKDGLPVAKIFVKPTLANGDKVSVTACHELAEMLVDPACNLWADGGSGSLCGYEVCDAVEEEEFTIHGVAMSDFVLPSYFETFHAAHSVKLDFLGKLVKPLQILPNGYMLVQRAGTVKEVFGSAAKERKFHKEDRRGHRTEYRKRAHHHASFF